jgi:hypothetical protein
MFGLVPLLRTLYSHCILSQPALEGHTLLSNSTTISRSYVKHCNVVSVPENIPYVIAQNVQALLVEFPQPLAQLGQAPHE